MTVKAQDEQCRDQREPEYPEIPATAPIVLRMIYCKNRDQIDELTEERHVIPVTVFFGYADWHPEPQWFLKAWDLDRQAERDFPLRECDFGDLRNRGRPDVYPPRGGGE